MSWLFSVTLMAILGAFQPVAVYGASLLRSRPVVGILSQPYHDQRDYIAASYVKWLESAGARSIVIPYEADDDLLHEIFTQINGVLFPGGDAPLPPTAKSMWKMILQKNLHEDDFFPVWGTCLGFEFLVMLAAGAKDDNDGILQHGFDAENVTLPLIFPSEDDVIQSNGVYSTESQLYVQSSELREDLVKYNITMNNHHLGISPSQFQRISSLTDMFHITSTNLDRKGRSFVSTIESKKYPIFGVQFHPEKNNFEYGLMDALKPQAKYYSDEAYEVINHSQKAVELSMKLALFFVGQVRRSTNGNYNMTHRHPTVYEYPMVRGRGFEQMFIIPKAEHWQNKEFNKDKSIHDVENLFMGVALLLIMSSFIVLRSYKFGIKLLQKSYSDIPDTVAMELLSEHSLDDEQDGNRT